MTLSKSSDQLLAFDTFRLEDFLTKDHYKKFVQFCQGYESFGFMGHCCTISNTYLISHRATLRGPGLEILLKQNLEDFVNDVETILDKYDMVYIHKDIIKYDMAVISPHYRYMLSVHFLPVFSDGEMKVQILRDMCNGGASDRVTAWYNKEKNVIEQYNTTTKEFTIHDIFNSTQPCRILDRRCGESKRLGSVG